MVSQPRNNNITKIIKINGLYKSTIGYFEKTYIQGSNARGQVVYKRIKDQHVGRAT